MELIYINSLMIGILFIVILVNTIILYITNQNVQKQELEINETHKYLKDVNEDLDVLFFKIKGKIDSSLIDLAEFKNLDPKLKTLYKDLIVKQIMPIINEAINKEENLNGWFSKNQDNITKVIKNILPKN